LIRTRIKLYSKILFVYICKEKDNEEKFKERDEKFAHAAYLTLKYVTSSVTGYLILKDTIMFPWYMGGSGSLMNCFTNVPWHP
jgi:hypothetical protein